MIRLLLVIAALLSVTSPATAQLMPSEKLEIWRARLPALKAPVWHRDLHSQDVVWYTSAEMPAAYQHAGGFHSPSYNISADPTDAPLRHGEGGNANVQFPWQRAGGLDRSPSAVTATGLLLPPRPGGGRWPVVVWRGELPGDPRGGTEVGLRWIFPVGTTLFECVAHPVAGELVVGEVRARLREIDTWDVGLFRPFPRASDLAAALEARPDAPTYAAQIAALRLPTHVRTVDVTDRANRSRAAFVGTAGVAWLPELPAPVVRELLRRPFDDALGAAWAEADGVVCYSPTTPHAHQIVPAGWMGSLVGSDSDSCAKCHDTVGQHARRFDQHRGWYGHVRGDDFVFSFHPVAPSSVAYNGATLPVRLNASLVAAGAIEQYDPARHPRDVYRLLAWPARRRP